jgi:DtxR family Mn-dependent transcriptional regulator
MLMKNISQAREEYLECIYRLQKRDGIARTSEMVKMLNVVPGTITNTIKRLVKDGLVFHEPYKGVTLTKLGRKIAVDVLRKHRLSERLLTDILRVEWVDAHNAACQLEHSFTDDIINKLDEILDYPKTCPHGNPIPTENGDVIEEKSYPLTNLKIQEKGVVTKIEQEEPELLEYLDALDLRPGSSITILKKAPFNGPITIKVNNKIHALGRNIISQIWIKKNERTEVQ